MKKSEIKIGDVLDWGGEPVAVIEVNPEVIVENPSHGQAVAKPKDLQPL